MTKRNNKTSKKRTGARSDKRKTQRKNFEVAHPNAAGIDIGAKEIWVSVPEDRDEQPVRDGIVAEVTRTTVDELQTVQRMVERGQMRGQETIAERLGKALARRKVGKHFQVIVRDDGFDFSIDGP